MRIDRPEQLDALDFEKGGGLVPVVVQHGRTGTVLMLAYANREALQRTLETGLAWYWSRSRGRLWCKGETSSHTQRLISLHADCDTDAVLAQVEPAGPACHTGTPTCFAADRPTAPSEAHAAKRSARPPEAGIAERPITAPRRPTQVDFPGTAEQPDPSATRPNSPHPLTSPHASPGRAPLPTLAALAAVLDGRGVNPPEGSYTAKLLADRNLRLKKLGEEAMELALACAEGDRRAVAAEAADVLYHALVACLGAGVRLDDVLEVLEQRLAT